MRASYRVLEDTPGSILIQDEGVGMSITNDAEAVIEHLIQRGLVTPSKIVLYQDTEGNVDKLLHDGQKFIGFDFGAN